eukprot:CAMPEP_0182540224 /NCGR_PEP_ID=MMETSP1323-20130603/26692_1 /TAXON_ID=236787 /ORGANISM="Florenciella parvula, Strain RCC1693" /LENGTH=112 /DNA_ID=CAMNT_0024750853 /DNA_START=239 /DNA_END=573 /DNA_ORIENTATION=-
MASWVSNESWKNAAGRKDGSSGYKFGDLTRTLVKKTKAAVAGGTNSDDDLEHDLGPAVTPHAFDDAPDAHDEGASVSSSGSGGTSWKEAAGRRTGADGYKFGDVTRSLLSKA